MEVKQRYKQTEVGVIPEDWKTHQIGDLIQFQGGSQPDKETFVFIPKAGYIRLIQIRDYKTDKYETYVPSDLAKRFCTKDDIMIGRYGPPIFQILRGIDGAYNVALIKAIPNDMLNKVYAYYYLKQEQLFAFVEKLSQRSSGQTGVDLKELKAYPFPIPPTLEEQTAIATTLSDTDALIQSLEKLIAKKRVIKKGAMQELLNRKEGWVVKKLAEVAALHRENIIPVNFPDTLFFHFSLPAFDTNKLPVLEAGIMIKSNKFRIPKEAVLVSKLNPRIPRIWSPIDIPDDSISSTEFIILTPNDKITRDFLHVICSSPLFCERMELSATGTTGSHQRVNPKDVMKFEVTIPPTKDEQTRIANIHSDMDEEINALETKLAKCKQVKQGMMQNLLTGRIRLV